MISSRTPEGSPIRCPLCGFEGRVDLSPTRSDAPCPSCGCLIVMEPPPFRRRHHHRLRALATIAALGFLFGVAAVSLDGLGPTEWVILAVTAVLLFGRELARDLFG